MNWFITVDSRKHPYSTSRQWHVTHGNIRELVMALSKAYPGEDVTVTAHARVRLCVCDGVVKLDSPDLTQFYTGMSGQECHDWERMW